jgi:signal peptidase I
MAEGGRANAAGEPAAPEAATATTAEGGAAKERKRRSPRHVRSAARVLQKEARRILRKHGNRIAAEPAEAIRASLAAIDTRRAEEDWEKLEDEAEHLDELLHQHANFARKSAVRETLENILIAVMVALGLRSCFYEPFKIPSSSMMPTLRAGDHIFVNKFVYGIQIPFTTTVVGESWGDISRGDVIVFRYPINESEDFIKRVIGLPGDEIRVVGRSVSIKRAGESEFEEIQRKPMPEKCLDETGTKTAGNCTVYEETFEGKTYAVQYMLNAEDRDDLLPNVRTLKVPEGHLLVMGDNRNRSHDSLAWLVTVEAVGADKLLTLKDLRDLTSDNLFSLVRPDDVDVAGDGRHDAVTYLASHRSESHDLRLEVWRKPTLGAVPIFTASADALAGARPTTMAELLADMPEGPERDRALEVGGGIDRLVVAEDPEERTILALLEASHTVIELVCGGGVCRDQAKLGLRLAEIVGKFHGNHQQDTRTLLEPPKTVRYTPQWSGRGDTREHLFERRIAKPGTKGPAAEMRLRAFRKPEEGIDRVRDAALAAFDSDTATATRVPELGEQAFRVDAEQAFVFVVADTVRDIAIVFECGRQACGDAEAAGTIAARVVEGMPAASTDRRKMRVLMTTGDLPGSEELPVAVPELYEYDRIDLQGTVRGREHSVEIEAWLKPPEGVAAKVAAIGTTRSLAADASVREGGMAGEDDDAHHLVFPVPESETVVRLSCHKGLCPTRDAALQLARRAAGKAVDPTAFIDPDAERPRPFVPRGNVKGRAERIWLPLARFWLPIK